MSDDAASIDLKNVLSLPAGFTSSFLRLLFVFDLLNLLKIKKQFTLVQLSACH